MARHCIDKTCDGKVIKRGFFKRLDQSHAIQRFHCKGCLKNFSQATTDPCYKQHKRHLNYPLFELLSCGVTMRSSARILGTTKKTVARKLIWLGIWARQRQVEFLRQRGPFTEIQFDEMETFEHTKCKPLSIPLAVTKKERIILFYSVAEMPAKGRLAKISLKKYGKRKDERRQYLEQLLESIKPFISDETILSSDQCPRYPPLVQEKFPAAVYKTFKGRRGAVTGYGELKKGGRDPLFYLNHTAAMFRAHMSRLLRKTWATTKKPERLYDHLSLYALYHNTVRLNLR